MVLSGMVMILCVSSYLTRGVSSSWLSMMMVIVLLFSLAAILAQWNAFMAELCLVAWASPMPSHFDELARPCGLKIMSLVCGK